MSEQKMREALAALVAQAQRYPHLAPEIAAAREALAQQPVEAVELTDAELFNLWWKWASGELGPVATHKNMDDRAIQFARAVIAADRAKRGGGK